MKRLQIMIDEDMDEAVGRVSQAEGLSKAAVIRRAVRRDVEPLPPFSEDPLAGMVGADDFEPANIDATVYG